MTHDLPTCLCQACDERRATITKTALVEGGWGCDTSAAVLSCEGAEATITSGDLGGNPQPQQRGKVTDP